MTYHCFWIMGRDDVEPAWDCGVSGYRVRFEGHPRMEGNRRERPTWSGALESARS